MTQISRRMLLGGLGVTTLAVGSASYLGCTLQEGQLATLPDHKHLDVLLSDLVDATRIGRAARTQFGRPALYVAATNAPQVRDAMTIPCAVKRRIHLRQAVRADFGAGAIVICDRLVLSETEAMVAGLRA